MTTQQCRLSCVTVGCAAVALFCAAPARAGLVNPTSTVNIFYDYVNPTTVAPSQFFNGAPGGPPFSLAAPITTPADTTGPFNTSADSGFFFTDTEVTIYNNGTPGLSYCSDGTSTGSNCTDAYNKFDFVFTNEDITGVAVDPATPSNFLPATFGSHSGLTLLNPNEFTIDVTGDNPAFLADLIIDVTTGTQTPAATPLPAALPLFASGLGALGWFGRRRKRKNAAVIEAA
jgi:hypothetical protein